MVFSADRSVEGFTLPVARLAQPVVSEVAIAKIAANFKNIYTKIPLSFRMSCPPVQVARGAATTTKHSSFKILKYVAAMRITCASTDIYFVLNRPLTCRSNVDSVLLRKISGTERLSGLKVNLTKLHFQSCRHLRPRICCCPVLVDS